MDFNEFNVNTLFPSDNDAHDENTELDIDNLFSDNNFKNYVFNSSVLLKRTHIEKKNVAIWHMKKFKECCEKIKELNEKDITELIFDVVNDYSFGYNPADCIAFIKDKLDKQKLETVIISDSKLYISWASLEEKLCS